MNNENCEGCVKRAKIYAASGMVLGVAIGVGVFYLVGKRRG